ncbi:MAG TPA: ABC transporter transmembrane domain-containing protein, partial [Acidimicrobiales bacterium]|nr:ABC transporter transmembrane domain-containing protein [Acidimicrobiales bacterium]
MSARIELRLPGGETVTHEVTDRTEIGREGTDLVIDDPSVSRRHLAVEPIGDGLRVEDLGSSYGTFVDGARVDAPTVIDAAQVVTFGDSSLRLVAVQPPPAPDERATTAPTATMAPTAPAVPVEPVRPLAPGPVVADLEHIERDGIVVGFVPESAGADVAPSVLDTARRARRALAGFGSEPWGTTVSINLVDPFPSADDPNRVVTAGSVVDDATSTVWMVVTPESPPEPPHRVLALLFGAALPAADRVEHLVEGYGLHLAGTPQPDPEAVAAIGGTLADLPPDVRGPMAASFVAHLIAREGDDAFRRLVATPAAGLVAAWSQIYGRSEAALEQAWWQERSEQPSDVGTFEFLRLSWRYLRPYRARQAEIFVLMLLSLAFTAAYPFVTRSLFDTAIPSGEMSEVLSLLALLGGAFAISLVAGLRQAYQSAWISGSVVRDLRAEMFAKLQQVPDAWVGRHPQGDVLSRMMNDVGRVQAGLSMAINDGIFQVIALVVSTVIMLRVNLLLGVIVLVGAPVVALVYRRMAGGARERSLAVQEESSAVLRVASESYSANQVVKLFRLGRHEQQRFDRASDRLFRAQQRLSLFGGLFGLSVESIVTLLRLGVLGLGTWLIFEGRFTLGGLVAFLGIMGEVLNPVTG